MPVADDKCFELNDLYSLKSRFLTPLCYTSAKNGRPTDAQRTPGGRPPKRERTRRSTSAPCLPNIVDMRSLSERIQAGLGRMALILTSLTCSWERMPAANVAC
jgi:hypothetical protein